MKRTTRNGLWIVALTAPLLFIGLAARAACNPQDCVTDVSPGSGGNPGVFGGVATVNAPPAQVPTEDAPPPPPPVDPVTDIQNQIKNTEDAIFKASDASSQADLQKKLDDLKNSLNNLQNSIDAANQAAAALTPPPPSSPPPPPPPPTNKKFDNGDIATWAKLLGGKKAPTKGQLDLLDGANDAKKAAQDAGDALKGLFGGK